VSVLTWFPTKAQEFRGLETMGIAKASGVPQRSERGLMKVGESIERIMEACARKLYSTCHDPMDKRPAQEDHCTRTVWRKQHPVPLRLDYRGGLENVSSRFNRQQRKVISHLSIGHDTLNEFSSSRGFFRYTSGKYSFFLRLE
jgi:hypothetical protein